GRGSGYNSSNPLLKVLIVMPGPDAPGVRLDPGPGPRYRPLDGRPAGHPVGQVGLPERVRTRPFGRGSCLAGRGRDEEQENQGEGEERSVLKREHARTSCHQRANPTSSQHKSSTRKNTCKARRSKKCSLSVLFHQGAAEGGLPRPGRSAGPSHEADDLPGGCVEAAPPPARGHADCLWG